jgi:ribulose 1,5-bisphosphate synthetase/thiazole synthase
VLLASGMIVGEGIIGVLVAALVAFSGKDFPLDMVGDTFANGGAVWLGGLVFALVIYALYRRVARAL